MALIDVSLKHNLDALYRNQSLAQRLHGLGQIGCQGFSGIDNFGIVTDDEGKPFLVLDALLCQAQNNDKGLCRLVVIKNDILHHEPEDQWPRINIYLKNGSVEYLNERDQAIDRAGIWVIHVQPELYARYNKLGYAPACGKGTRSTVQ